LETKHRLVYLHRKAIKMGIAERKERDKQEMKKAIMEAAMHIFTEEGYEGASIRKIADKIEYSAATIYLYYKDKDELLYDLQAECFMQLVDAFQRDITSSDPFTRLQQLCHSYINFGLANPDMYQLMFVLKSPMNKIKDHQVWHNADGALGVLISVLSQCMEQGLLKFDSVEQAAASVWAIGHGLLSLNISCRMDVMGMDDHQMADTMHAVVDNYLKTIKI
jgi:AcrR family transcriptional regulator